MNNWAFVGKTKNIALKNEEKIHSKNIIATLPKVKDDKEIKLSLRNKVKKKEINEEIENGRDSVKKNNRILENSFYSRFIKENKLENKYENIMKEEGLDRIIIELSDLLPKKIDKIEVENNFIFLDRSLVKDNLERIEDLKKNKY